MTNYIPCKIMEVILIDALISVKMHTCYLFTPPIGSPVRLADFQKAQSGCGTHTL